MKILQGLCIGGPFNGEMRECSSPVMEIEFSPLSYPPHLQKQKYLHRYLIGNEVESRGFWVHESIKSEQWLDFLIEQYQHQCELLAEFST